MTNSAEKNLLFGIIALQVDFINREQLLLATQKWLGDKSQKLDELLVEQGMLRAADRELLAPLVARHLENHGGDALQSLATLSTFDSLADELRELGDSALEVTLSVVSDAQSSVRANLPTGEETVDSGVGPASSLATPKDTSHDSADVRFRILRSHAKGGLGEVYVARDTELNREVALKEIQTRYADDETSRSRFLLEAEVTGGLEHPGIVPVYGLGRYDDGRPFYAMRFIKGDSLKEAADRFHGRFSTGQGQASPGNRSAAVDFESLEFRKLLGRFIDVCQAIEYAHSRGVLHRDLKPGNIMLGKYGETLVVDWGLAKAQGRDDRPYVNDEATLRPASASGTAPTIMGSAIGTPAFMPPEQAAGDLDQLGPASDVYSLGATLYYVLTGRAPFKGADLKDTLDQVRAGRFALPNAVLPTAPKALSAICVKAMAMSPADRYQSPQEMAEDVECFLADEPTSAYREPVAQRARRWIRRHRTLAAGVGAAVMVGILGLGVFSTIITAKNSELAQANADERAARLLAQRNEREATAQRRSAESAKRLAEDNAEVARGQTALALETMSSVIFEIQNGLENVPGAAQVRRELLKTALERLQKIADEFVVDGRADHATVVALGQMGDLFLRIGVGNIAPSEFAEFNPSQTRQVEDASAVSSARLLYENAFRIAEERLESDPTNVIAQQDLAQANDRMGEICKRTGRADTALTHLSKSLEIRKRLADASPEDRQLKRNLSNAFLNLAEVQVMVGRLGEARATHQAGLDLRLELATQNPEEHATQRDVAAAWIRMGTLQFLGGEIPQALASFQQGKEVLESLPQSAFDPMELAFAIGQSGDMLRRLGRIDESLAAQQQVRQICEAALELDAEDRVAESQLSNAYLKIGDAQFQTGQVRQALASYQESLARSQEIVERDPQDQAAVDALAATYQKLGNVHFRMGDLGQALACFGDCLELIERLAADSPSNTMLQRSLSVALNKVGDVQLQLMKRDEALASFQRALRIIKAQAEADPNNALLQRDLSISFDRVGDVYYSTDDPASALREYQQGLAIREKLAEGNPTSPPAQHALVISHAKLGLARRDLNQYQESVDTFVHAIELAQAVLDRGQLQSTFQPLVNSLQKEAQVSQRLVLATGDWDVLLGQPADRLPDLLAERGRRFVKQARVVEAAQAANKLSGLDQSTAEQLYDAACILSQCAASISTLENDPMREENEKQRQLWIGEALSSLKKAIEAGWEDFEHLRQDDDLELLRELPEFKSLIPGDACVLRLAHLRLIADARPAEQAATSG